MGTVPYPSPQDIFMHQYQLARRDEVVGILLALLLGCFGAHHFYVGRTGLGILYLCFCWTGIPAILGVVECFFMPGRVRMYNAMQAAGLAAALGIPIPGYQGYAPPVYVSVQASSLVPEQSALMACGNCGRVNAAGARFCPGCGKSLV